MTKAKAMVNLNGTDKNGKIIPQKIRKDQALDVVVLMPFLSRSSGQIIRYPSGVHSVASRHLISKAYWQRFYFLISASSCADLGTS